MKFAVLFVKLVVALVTFILLPLALFRTFVLHEFMMLLAVAALVLQFFL